MSLDLKEELAFFSRYNFHAYVGCSVWNIAFIEGLWTWTLVLEFISNTERRWQEPWGPDIFRPNFFLPPSFSHKFVSFVSSGMYLYLLSVVQSLYQESASFYLLLKKDIYNSLTLN